MSRRYMVIRAETSEEMEHQLNNLLVSHPTAEVKQVAVHPISEHYTIIAEVRNGYSSDRATIGKNESGVMDRNTLMSLVETHGAERAGELFGQTPEEFVKHHQLPKNDPLVRLLKGHR